MKPNIFPTEERKALVLLCIAWMYVKKKSLIGFLNEFRKIDKRKRNKIWLQCFGLLLKYNKLLYHSCRSQNPSLYK